MTTIDLDQLAADALPTAAALTVAVADHDQDLVRDVLTGLDTLRLRALAVVLAAHVDPDKPFISRGPVNVVRSAVHLVAARYGITEHLVHTSRTQVALDARAVACYVGHLAGMSSVAVGRDIGRDHSSVLNAWGRVGANPKLRAIANDIANHLGFPTRPALTDDEVLAS